MKVTFKSLDGKQLVQFVGKIAIGSNTHVIIGDDVYAIVATKTELNRTYGFVNGVTVTLMKLTTGTKEKEERK